MITLEQAHVLVNEYAPGAGAVWFEGETVVDRPGYWFFPVGFIGSRGVVVDKTTGTLTQLGSCHTLDDWLWGYEHGFLGESITLRVTAVADLEQTLQVLQSSISAEFRWRYELRNWIKACLCSLPAEFVSHDLALSIPRYRAALKNAWFTFDVRSA